MAGTALRVSQQRATLTLQTAAAPGDILVLTPAMSTDRVLVPRRLQLEGKPKWLCPPPVPLHQQPSLS